LKSGGTNVCDGEKGRAKFAESSENEKARDWIRLVDLSNPYTH